MKGEKRVQAQGQSEERRWGAFKALLRLWGRSKKRDECRQGKGWGRRNARATLPTAVWQTEGAPQREVKTTGKEYLYICMPCAHTHTHTHTLGGVKTYVPALFVRSVAKMMLRFSFFSEWTANHTLPKALFLPRMSCA